MNILLFQWRHYRGWRADCPGDTLQGGDTPVKSIDSDEQKIDRQFFSGKIAVTPSFAAPGDTNLSDATVLFSDTEIVLHGSKQYK